MLPEWKDGDDGPDPHDKILFPALPGSPLQERNPLPQHEPPNIQPFLGRAVELQRLVLMLRRRQRVRLISLFGPAGVGKTSLATRRRHLYEQRWFTEGAVVVDMHNRRTEDDALSALSEALDMELDSMLNVSRTLQRWQGLLVLDDCDAAIARDASSTAKEAEKLLPRLLGKLLATQEVRVLCTSRVAIPRRARARWGEAALAERRGAFFRELAMEALPADLRPLDALRSHPVLAALENLPRAIWQTVPLLRKARRWQRSQRPRRRHHHREWSRRAHLRRRR